MQKAENSKKRTITGVEKITLTKGDLFQLSMKSAKKRNYKKRHFAELCRRRWSAKKVHALGKRDSDECTGEEYTYSITRHSVLDEAQLSTEVTIGGKTVKWLIDSEARVNVNDTCTFDQVGNTHISST